MQRSPAHPDGEPWNGVEPSTGTAFWRACRLRCPRCGLGKLFRRWFSMTDPCPRCRLAFEAEEGAFVGSMTLNYAMTSGVFVLVLVVGVAMTAPDIPVAQLTAASVLAIAVAPVVFYPFTKTAWAAIHYLAHRSEPGV